MTQSIDVRLPTREAVVRRAVTLNRLTLGYNAAEAVVALGAGFAAGSISLVGSVSTRSSRCRRHSS